VSASASPIETEPAAAPLAVVVAVAFVVAAAVSEPSVVAVPLSSVAAPRTLEMAIATAGLIETPGPVAPAVAVVVAVLVDAAVNVVAPKPVSAAPAPTVARVSISIRLSATAAPMPKELPPAAVLGSAFAVEVEVDVATSATAAPPALLLDPEFSTASVPRLTMLSASDPATPTDPPPAPLEASAPKLEALVVEVRFSPTVDTVPEIELSARTSARSMATPTPTLALPPPTAAPSAFALASTIADAVSESAPGELRLAPAGTSAMAVTFATFTAIAAPTLTLPPLVDALGVLGALVLPPPLFDWVVAAKLRSPAS
jgi:hypothetical protein